MYWNVFVNIVCMRVFNEDNILVRQCIYINTMYILYTLSLLYDYHILLCDSVCCIYVCDCDCPVSSMYACMCVYFYLPYYTVRSGQLVLWNGVLCMYACMFIYMYVCMYFFIILFKEEIYKVYSI